MKRDRLGAGYVLSSGPEFPVSGAVEVEPFRAPQTEAEAAPAQPVGGRGWVNDSATDWPLSHATQQVFALFHAREQAGFEETVRFRLTSDLGESTFFYNTTSGAWREET